MDEESAGRWMTGFSLGEGIVVAVLLGVLAAFAVAGTRGVLSRVKVLEAVDLSAGVKTEWMEHWSVTGSWPTPAPGAAAPASVLALSPSVKLMAPHYVEAKQEDVEDGSLAFTFAEPCSVTSLQGFTLGVSDAALHGYSVGIRPAFAPARAPTSVVWLCGYAEPPPGFVAPTKNLTDAPAALLPSPCRAPLRAER
jgi:type IV pilus assembly protein PilA